MFEQLPVTNWTTILAGVALFVSAGIFLWVVYSAVRMPRQRVEHDSRLPLEEETQK